MAEEFDSDATKVAVSEKPSVVYEDILEADFHDYGHDGSSETEDSREDREGK